MNNTVNKIREFIVDNIRSIGNIDQVYEESNLQGLGMDSMTATNIMVDIEDEYGITFSDELLTPETFYSPKTLASAVDYLLKTQAKA